MTAGVKYDNNKLRWSLVPEGVMDEVIQVLEYGAKKYAPDNWKHVPQATTRYYDAAMRHINAWWQGEGFDAETKRSHLAHAICCLMFLQWLEESSITEEDKAVIKNKMQYMQAVSEAMTEIKNRTTNGKEFP
jgi:hypothetical protein